MSTERTDTPSRRTAEVRNGEQKPRRLNWRDRLQQDLARRTAIFAFQRGRDYALREPGRA